MPKDIEINPDDYENLFLDDLPLRRLSRYDKAYLEKFVNLQWLSLKDTKLCSVMNLPKV